MTIRYLRAMIFLCLACPPVSHAGFVGYWGVNEINLQYDDDELAASYTIVRDIPYTEGQIVPVLDEEVSSTTGRSLHFVSSGRVMTLDEFVIYIGSGTSVSQHADNSLFEGAARTRYYGENRFHAAEYGFHTYRRSPIRIRGNVSTGGWVSLYVKTQVHQSGCYNPPQPVLEDINFETSSPGPFDVTLPGQVVHVNCVYSENSKSGSAFITMEMKAFDGDFGNSEGSYSSIEIVDQLDTGNEDPEVGDVDSDGVPDETDNCPLLANPDQVNTDGADDGGDACDSDDDNDGWEDDYDNCRRIANPQQEDSDEDGCGDACVINGCGGPVCVNS